MSDASEVKRWEISCSQASHFINGPTTDGFVVVMAVEDHDRIMAERDELWKRATKFVMPGEMDTGESIEHYIKTLEQTIARQARVIEKLKLAVTDIANKNTCWRLYEIDKYKSYEDAWEGVAEFAGIVLNELAAIEQQVEGT